MFSVRTFSLKAERTKDTHRRETNLPHRYIHILRLCVCVTFPKKKVLFFVSRTNRDASGLGRLGNYASSLCWPLGAGQQQEPYQHKDNQSYLTATRQQHLCVLFFFVVVVLCLWLSLSFDLVSSHDDILS